MRNYHLILNPTAKSGKGKNKWDSIISILNSNNINYTISTSKHSGHAIELSKQACSNNKIDVIVAVGGDGTINEVLNGMCLASAEQETLPELGILYTGTSPDICRYHNISIITEEAVKTLIHNTGKEIDVGEVHYIQNTKKITSWFLCSVNLGIGAMVAEGSNTGLRKYLGDFLGTLLSIIWSAIKYKKSDLQCIIDGKEKLFQNTLNMTLGKNPYIASGVKVNVDVKPDDGKMYLFSINNMNLLSLIFNLPKIYNGEFYNHPNNTLINITNFSCEYNENSPDVEFDGDPQGTLPCKIQVLKKRIKLIK